VVDAWGHLRARMELVIKSFQLLRQLSAEVLRVLDMTNDWFEVLRNFLLLLI
jgi:hypothetical protein